jgi:ribosomal protein S18 acetylase RimI-like enzyme
MEIRRYQGDRAVLRPLFREADDSEQAIDAYVGEGEVLVAVEAGRIVGYGQLVGAGAGRAELKSMAVLEERRGAGVGRALVDTMLQSCRERGLVRLLVATAAADTRNLRFYQRQGFRLLRIERDAFGPGTGYPEGLLLDGIPLRDRVWLDQDL